LGPNQQFSFSKKKTVICFVCSFVYRMLKTEVLQCVSPKNKNLNLRKNFFEKNLRRPPYPRFLSHGFPIGQRANAKMGTREVLE